MVISVLLPIFVGIIAGFASGLGLGGGTLLIIWLHYAMKLDSNIIRSINLLFFLPAAAASTWIHFRKQRIPWRRILPGAIAGCITSAIVAIMSLSVSPKWIQTVFGILLIIVGIQQLLFRQKNVPGK